MSTDDHAALLPPMTSREREVLGLVTRGLSNKEIARRLHLSVSTVKCHVHSVLTKAGLQRRGQLASWEAADPAMARGSLFLQGLRADPDACSPARQQ